MRVRECKNEIVRILTEADIESAFLEASIFIRKATSWTKVQELMNDKEELAFEIAEKAISMARERAKHIPTSYITGEKEFYGLNFFVSPNCLIPRPDTETLVETGLEAIKAYDYHTVLDMCTGSGAIAIAIKANAQVDVTAVDISEKALAIAKLNAETLLDEKIHFIQSNLFENVKGSFDLIVSNPPYVTQKWYDEVEEEVKKEPLLALIDYAEDGLDIIRKIIKDCKAHLNEGGTLAFECDYRQTESLKELLNIAGFSETEIIYDLNNKPRVVKGRLCTQS